MNTSWQCARVGAVSLSALGSDIERRRWCWKAIGCTRPGGHVGGPRASSCRRYCGAVLRIGGSLRRLRREAGGSPRTDGERHRADGVSPKKRRRTWRVLQRAFPYAEWMMGAWVDPDSVYESQSHLQRSRPKGQLAVMVRRGDRRAVPRSVGRFNPIGTATPINLPFARVNTVFPALCRSLRRPFLRVREVDRLFEAPPLPHCARGVPQAGASQVGTLKPRSRFLHYSGPPSPEDIQKAAGSKDGACHFGMYRASAKLCSERIKMATGVGAGSKHTPADREYLSADMAVLHEFLQQPAQKSAPDASTTRQFVSDLVRVKIEATPFLAPVRSPPIRSKRSPKSSACSMLLPMSRCASDEGGREILDSLGFGTRGRRPGSNLEVMEVLGNNSDSAEPDACSESSDDMRPPCVAGVRGAEPGTGNECAALACKHDKAAFELLPELLLIGNSISVRHAAVRRLDITESTSIAVETAVNLSNRTLAVEMMEQGLATIFQQMLQLKTNVDALQLAQAHKLQTLSSELYSGNLENPLKIVNVRDDLLTAIRQEPGCEYFFRPQTYSVLYHASQGGPVLMLNSHGDYCDAIVIPRPTSDPIHIPLQNVTLDILESQRDTLRSCFIAAMRHQPPDALASGNSTHPNRLRSPLQSCWTDFGLLL
ncbi:hypothetical protein DFH09DRAFT_1277426 [Mycena vulgaris]|nr:hypothetical protein DFH09DRAFT_1277426 [Mycena vulgaris]